MKEQENKNQETERVVEKVEAENLPVVQDQGRDELEMMIREYMDLFRSDDPFHAIPAIKIKHSLSRDEASEWVPDGNIYSTVLGNLGKEIAVTPCFVVNARVLWTRNIAGQGPECQSLDSVHGTAGILCEGCDKRIENLFPGAPTSDMIKKSCKPRRIFAVISEELGLPHLLAMTGRSYKAGLNWVRFVKISMIKDQWQACRYAVSTSKGSGISPDGEARVFTVFRVRPLPIVGREDEGYFTQIAMAEAARATVIEAYNREHDVLLSEYHENWKKQKEEEGKKGEK